MPYRKRRNTDEEGTKKLLDADRELDEHSEKTDEEDEIIQKGWLHMQQINEEKKDKHGDGDGSEKTAN
jgi:hypothetical protein